ncbi:MAG: SagB/ThcOx family dehydrogenase [Kiritimatiellae bacterium]|nr:SagB/ThcOx family dehydrogenase [Kiritimatiellia bacterium]MDD5522626.1 SagB/ThcOx family dehydrogenase [Kiritimatiellia bacterium]
MKKVVAVILAIITFTCSCRQIPTVDTPTGTDGIKTLDAIPLEQLHVFLRGYAGDWRKDTAENRGAEAPPIQKPYSKDTKLINLVRPENIKIGNAPLAKIINQRRSRRVYTNESLSNEELSFLLWSTQGISKMEKDAEGRITHHFRTVPSGGARHPFETYLIVNRVEGIKPGLYRFLPIEHKLLVIREADDLPRKITDACYGQKHPGEAAVVFIWSVIPFRTEWHYGHIAHKLITIDAGHLCQNLYLSAESIGAGTCAMLGYNQSKLDKLIEVDGKEEFAFYLAPVGKIKPD